MGQLAELEADVVVEAPPSAVWELLIDWDRQQEWMLGTRVHGTAQRGHGVGAGVEAFTGVGKVGFRDPMVITDWEPPRRIVVVHTGNVVRGTGAFEVFALPKGRSRFVWTERLDLPLGWAGRVGWTLAKLPFRAGVQSAMRKFARLVEAENAR
ncbi:MAG: SRPBCC family protein [Candidatus Nanopelagicales bacterium]